MAYEWMTSVLFHLHACVATLDEMDLSAGISSWLTIVSQRLDRSRIPFLLLINLL